MPNDICNQWKLKQSILNFFFYTYFFAKLLACIVVKTSSLKEGQYANIMFQ